jgi:hypothetical protein
VPVVRALPGDADQSHAMRQRLSEPGKCLRSLHETLRPRWMDLLHDMGCSEAFLLEGDGLLLEIMSFKRTSLQVSTYGQQYLKILSQSTAASTAGLKQYSMCCSPCCAGLETTAAAAPPALVTASSKCCSSNCKTTSKSSYHFTN